MENMGTPLKLIYSQSTGTGKKVKKEGVWIADNGHAIKVPTLQNITGRCTWASRDAAYANVAYACECGRTKTYHGSAKKAHLSDHDSWFTPEQIAHIDSMLNELIAGK
jgi:hypothetical protein